MGKATHKTPAYHALKWAWLVMLFLFCIPAFSQNTKGDKAAGPLPRIIQKLKPQKTRKVKSTTRDISGRRLRTKNKSSAARAIERAPNTYSGRGKKGDKPGRPIRGRINNRSSTAKAARNNVYPNTDRFIYNPSSRPRKNERSYPNSGRPVQAGTNVGRSKTAFVPRKSRVAPRTASRSFLTRGRKNVYWGKFSKGEKPFTKDLTGRPVRAKNFRSPSPGVQPQISPYYNRNKSGDHPNKTSGGGIFSATKRGQKAWKKDISNHPIRGSLSSARVKHKQPIAKAIGRGNPSRSNKGQGAGPLPTRIPSGGARVSGYRGTVKGSRKKPSKKAGGIFGGLKRKRQEKGGGSISGQSRNNGGSPIPVRFPSSGGARVGGFSGNIKSQRPGKGGGSISGRARNNGGSPIPTQLPGSGAMRGGRFSGNIKSHRPEKGGGSISGRTRNNGGVPIYVRRPTSKVARQIGGLFSGTIVEVPKKKKGAGGSISGRSRNNGGLPIATVLPGSGAMRGGSYSGNIKSHKPAKGGGSISGRARNNGGSPIPTQLPSSGAMRGGRFSGNIKSHRPEKGGGSISGRSRNNGGVPITVRRPRARVARQIGGLYAGMIVEVPKKKKGAGGSISNQPRNNGGKAISVLVYPSQGEQFAGHIKAHKPSKGGGSVSRNNWNNNGQPILSLAPRSNDVKAANYGGKTKVKRGDYGKRPGAKEGTLKGIKPKAPTVKASQYEGRMKIFWNLKHNPSSNELALSGRKPNRSFGKSNEFQGRTRLTKNYRHTPMGDKNALKVIGPGKAYAKIGNFQGNLKMRKPHGPDLHPDAKFAHGRENNVKNERTIFTNVKLWWSSVFKKNDTQPTAVKQKIRRPRYDKKERELWKDLYD